MREMRELPVRLTRDEIASKGIGLVQLIRRRAALEAECSRERARIKAHVEDVAAEAAQIEYEIETGEEVRPVPCEAGVEEATHTYQVVREDTGEVIESRPATVQELQRPLPLAREDRERRKGKS